MTRSLIMAHAAVGSWFGAQAELNLEGFTLRRGELNPGIYGEGYYDRRHPHTLAHDVTLTISSPAIARSVPRLSLTAGRGFGAFGTDDPMSRPFVKFPANHHLAQLLERVVVVAAMARPLGAKGMIAAEGSIFNGDDPVGPFAAPQWKRFGDSWSARVTATRQTSVTGIIEGQASYAALRSPDIAFGGGLDQRKRSASIRFENAAGSWRPYGLLEWASTDVMDRSERAYALRSALAEVAGRVRGVGVAARLEITDRPEEERGLDPFRSPRPPHDFLNLGITRWSIASVRISRDLARGAVAPFVEVSSGGARALLRGSVFQPALFYGASRITTLAAGMRLGLGSSGHGRMGRYGVAAALDAGPAKVP